MLQVLKKTRRCTGLPPLAQVLLFRNGTGEGFSSFFFAAAPHVEMYVVTPLPAPLPRHALTALPTLSPAPLTFSRARPPSRILRLRQRPKSACAWPTDRAPQRARQRAPRALTPYSPSLAHPSPAAPTQILPGAIVRGLAPPPRAHSALSRRARPTLPIPLSRAPRAPRPYALFALPRPPLPSCAHSDTSRCVSARPGAPTPRA